MLATMSLLKWRLRFLLLAVAALGLPASSQSNGNEQPTYLLRMERQIRDEDVCILVSRDGQFHLERITLGFDRSRVFEGSFPASTIADLEKMLDAEELQRLAQSQIKMALIGEELDHVLIAISRPDGWQSLNFPTGNSRKTFRNVLDPLVKWLERAEQQPHPLPNVVPGRCMPPQTTIGQTSAANGGSAGQDRAQAPSQTPQSAGYLVRIVTEHYLPNDLNFGAKAERTCVVVYHTGRYRMEKSKQELNSTMRTDVFRDTLSDAQIQELRQILDAPDLMRLSQRSAGAGVTIREGEITNLAIPRAKDTQTLSFASFFGARTQEKGMRDNTRVSIDEDVQFIKALRKWVKTNIEDRKLPATDVPATTCIPSTQPE